MARKKPAQSSRVPTGRIERLARLGWMTGEFALGGAAERVRQAIGASDGSEADANPFLNPAAAERLAKHLSRMRGAAMKVGQMLSLLDDRMVPPEFAEALAILRDSADTMPEGQVRSVMAREFGPEWQDLFREFDFEPIAAASIGQVHTATALDGRELALKIQYPGVAESIDSDIDNLAMALRAAQVLPGDLDLEPIIAELKGQMRQEADYEAEARFLERFGACIGEDARYVVPDVYPDLTTPRVLAMERLLGVPLEDLAGVGYSQAVRNEIGGALIELMCLEFFDYHLTQTDPNFSNYLLMQDGVTIGLLDFGSTREIEPELSEMYRRLLAGLRRADRSELEALYRDMGSLREGDPDEMVDLFYELVCLMYEPLAHRGVYTFGQSDAVSRAQQLGMELFFKHRFARTPPAETIFLQRKLDGTLLLCARIRAEVDVGAIVDRFIG
jgi:predicted unusual protein kinase regulating ubiquinone biosynthesis (AarF/ABC1/UbiB family)